jgi:DNA adenine methylase
MKMTGNRGLSPIVCAGAELRYRHHLATRPQSSTLSAAHLRLSNAHIENITWQECIKRYDRPHTFFYMDPPYWETEGYGVPFEFDQYVQMCALAKSMKGKVMISLNDHPQIRECFADLHIETVDIEYSLGNKHGHGAERGELVITNYDPHQGNGGLF